MHVIIVGGGIAGLYMAHLCSKSCEVSKITLLEKNKQVGGRIFTVNDTDLQGNHVRYEAGAGRINSTHERTMWLLKTFRIQLARINANYQYISENLHFKSRKVYVAMIHEVMSQTSSWPYHKLRSVSFGHVCSEILGEEKAQLAKAIFGYNAEFEAINAYDGLEMFKRDFQGDVDYYVAIGGLDQLTHKMHKSLMRSKKFHAILDSFVTQVRYTKNDVKVTYTDVNGDKHIIHGDKLVCALPRNALNTLFPKHTQTLNCVTPIALNRAYGFVDPQWLQGVPITTSPGRIRQFIPINPRTGLAMVSYTDHRDAQYWKKHEHNPELINHELKRLFGKEFPEAQKIKHYYWKAGIHVWKPRINSKKASEDVMFLEGKDAPLYVVGEAYSHHQGWIEGALETVERALPFVLNDVYRRH